MRVCERIETVAASAVSVVLAVCLLCRCRPSLCAPFRHPVICSPASSDPPHRTSCAPPVQRSSELSSQMLVSPATASVASRCAAVIQPRWAAATHTRPARIPRLAPPAHMCDRSRHSPLMLLVQTHRDMSSSSAFTPQRFHTDGMHCIFRMLSLADVLSAFHSCRSWLAAGCKERGRTATFTASKAWLTNACASPFKHCITALDASEREEEHGQEHYNHKDLTWLHHLPSLTSVRLSLDVGVLYRFLEAADKDTRSRPMLVSGLHSLHITAKQQAGTSLRHRIIREISGMPSLTALSLDLKTSDLDLSPLCSMKQLRRFEFAATSDALYSDVLDAQSPAIRDIRQFASLQQLVLLVEHATASECLEALCAPGHALTRLREILLQDHKLTADDVGVLSSIPSIDTLMFARMEPEAVTQLHLLPALRTALIVTAPQWRPVPLLLPGIVRCANLTDLLLSSFTATEAELLRFVAQLPGLRSLSFHCCEMGTLTPLRALRQLTSLQLVCCAPPSLDLLFALAPISQLRSLTLGLPSDEIVSARTLRSVFPTLRIELASSEQLPQLMDVRGHGMLLP